MFPNITSGYERYLQSEIQDVSKHNLRISYFNPKVKQKITQFNTQGSHEIGVKRVQKGRTEDASRF
jgi:hypothetical protein